MDLNDFWQENKRFVLSVLAALIVFFIALRVVDGKYHKKAAQSRAAIERMRADLAQPLFKPSDLARAREQGRALDEVLAKLAPRLEFQPRQRFSPVAHEGSVSSLYFSVGSETREQLIQLAGRSSLRLPDSFGLPASVVDEDQITRYLECLDLVDRVVRLAIEAGVERIDEIRMRLDPRLLSGRQLDTFEQNSIEFEMSGASAPLVRLLALSQSLAGVDADGVELAPLTIGSVELKAARAKRDEALLMVTFQVVHLHGLEELVEVDS